MALNNFVHVTEVTVEQVDHVVWEQGFGHGGEPPHVGEKNRHESLVAYRCRHDHLRPLIHLGFVSTVENKPSDCYVPGDRGLTCEADFGRKPKAISEQRLSPRPWIAMLKSLKNHDATG